MPVFEYKVVPAPQKGQKAKGVKGTRERFALALETVMNELGAEGWEYVRADMLPCEERSGLTGSTTVYQNLLVFRRTTGPEAAEAEPARPAAPAIPFARPRPAVPEPVAEAAEEAPEPVAEETGDEAEPVSEPHDAEAPGKPTSTTDAAAAAAAAALTAYRDRARGAAPRLGPADRD